MKDKTKSVRRIPFFSPLYPDELLYSACARYSDRVAFGSKSFAIQDLFGDANAKALIDLPYCIDHFISVLPPGHTYNADQIINKNTLFPVYAPFLTSKERWERLRQDMRGNSGFNMHKRAGIIARNIYTLDWLQFCPCCIEEDKKKFGEPYWHRIHQLPGIKLCPHHEVFLENSNVRAKSRLYSRGLISAQNSLTDIPAPRFIDHSNPIHLSLLRIAHNMFWLLNQDDLEPDLPALNSRYFCLLAQHELLSHTGRIRVLKLQKAFREHHSEDLLKILGCEVNDGHENWLRRILELEPFGCTSHPLYHLLLIDFLGYSIEDFLKLSGKFHPFGLGPWPCLNPVCENYKIPSILEVEIDPKPSQQGDPVGVFKCVCGFTYRRTGPDHVSEDQYRTSAILSRGSLWETELTELWANLDVSLTEITKRLKAHRKTIIAYAARLNLPFPRKSKKGKLIESPEPPLNKIHQSDHSEKLTLYRQEWLSARAAYPSKGRTFMRNNFYRLHYWLNKYDKTWLEANSPASASCKSFPKEIERINVDWSVRDAQLSSQIASIIERIKSKPGHPIKVSLAEITRELGLRSSLSPLLSKLPLTSTEISRGLESREDFTIRKIWWVFNCYRVQNVTPGRWRFIRAASVKSCDLKSAEVQRVLDEAIRLLRSREQTITVLAEVEEHAD